jgi:hypothetical protein
MSWIHKRTKSCPRCSNPIEVLLFKGQSLRQANAHPTIAEKWRLQPHEVRAMLSAFLLALHVANNGLWPFLGRL